jgi:hypothetical protein
MNIPVVIEPVSGNGYRARGGEPFALTAEGATPEDALAHFRSLVSAKLQGDVRLAAVEIGPAEHSWLPFAGMYDQGDPVVAEWLAILRREQDQPEAN